MMDWQQKCEALKSIAPLKLCMREINDWYVEQGIEVSSDNSSILTGMYGNGVTPQSAVKDHWRVLVNELPEDQYLVVNGGNKNRKHYRWNKYMWNELPIKNLEDKQ